MRVASGCEVTRSWQGKKVVCIASGPSLSKDQLEQVRLAREADAVRVIVVNDNYLVAPWADVLYFADHRWWEWHRSGIAKSWGWVSFTAEQVKKALASFAGQKVTIKHPTMANGPDIFSLDNDGSDGLSEKPTGIRTGSNSGYQALNIAVLAGGNPILLLGYDMSFPGGRSHAHNGHPVKMGQDVYLGFAKNFVSMKSTLDKLGVRVVNCTAGSSITAFQFGDLAAEL